jgi:hypothetical protein
MPDRWQLTRLARQVAMREQRLGRPVDTVRVECWRTEYDPVSLAATLRGLCDFRLDPGDGSAGF